MAARNPFGFVRPFVFFAWSRIGLLQARFRSSCQPIRPLASSRGTRLKPLIAGRSVSVIEVFLFQKNAMPSNAERSA